MRRGFLFLLPVLGCYSGGPTGLAPPAPAADAPLAASSTRLRRLSIRELGNAYAVLTGETVTASDFLPEHTATGFDNGPELAVVQTDQAARFEAVAWQVAEAVTERREPKVFGGCVDACEGAVLDEFAPRAYRRPLTDAERARLAGLYDSVAAQATPDDGLAALVAAIFQSPGFLYREEVGAPVAPGVVRLTGYEIASELSFFLTGNPPDDALLAAAARGDLDAGDARRSEGARLLATPEARLELRTFLRQWMALDDLAETTKIAPNPLTPAVIGAMNDDVDFFLDHVLWESSGSLDELFTSSEGLVGATLAPFYGVHAADPPAPVLLDPAIRRGILTRLGWLSVHSNPDSSGPIARGVFVLGSLLCQPPPPPPPGISRVPPNTAATHTTREQFEAHVENPSCQVCHKAIDGIGFGFEEFDSTGQYRTTQGGEEVDSSGELDETHGGDGPFVGAAQLSAHLLESEDFRSCFVKQVYRFMMGAPEDATTLPDLMATASSYGIDDRLQWFILELVASDAFVTRRSAP
jgi:uncharacterized protein DUF1588/uncharacterized protein DUF1592/uncharacterized protein DUF1595/uncharacterized protein DUF1585